jgi:hypothetical protein
VFLRSVSGKKRKNSVAHRLNPHQYYAGAINCAIFHVFVKEARIWQQPKKQHQLRNRQRSLPRKAAPAKAAAKPAAVKKHQQRKPNAAFMKAMTPSASLPRSSAQPPFRAPK